MPSSTYYDVIIIGGGAAGLMCAAVAAARGRKVIVLEHANKVGKKILMSGGGRCNFTNMYTGHENFLCNNPHFCKSALSRYTQWDFIALVDGHNLAYHEKTQGQLFCDVKAKDILAILLSECEQYGAEITTDTSLHSIKAHNDKSTNSRFALSTTLGELHAHSVVVATGGLSIPTMGATGFGHDIAKQFGHKLVSREAALVPFILEDSAQKLCVDLAGLSLDVEVHCNGTSFKDAMLFTHKGLSGPAILQISNYWYPTNSLTINFLPTINLSEIMQSWQKSGVKQELKNALSEYMPKRFANTWVEAQLHSHAITNKPVNQYTPAEIEQISQAFHQFTFIPKGTEGYRTAEVTRGGVNTDKVSSKTLESQLQPGLYFVGEVLDVTGWLGGFNFQWAWSSAWCAGQYA